jgi:acyl-coenzyme A thioesterase PaaI-like protein
MQDNRKEAVDALRRLSTLMVAHEIDADKLKSAASSLKQITNDLENEANSQRMERNWAWPEENGRLGNLMPTSPVAGIYNSFAPPIELWVENKIIKGTGVFDYQHEGPPNCVHGGVISLIFDTTLGCAAMFSYLPIMTGTLEIKFLKPTPIKQKLDMEARYLRTEGRKVFVTGTISFNGETTAQANGIWISFDPSKYSSIMAT